MWTKNLYPKVVNSHSESTVFITYSERTERLGSQSAALLLRLRSACHFLHRNRHDGWRLHQMSNRFVASRLKTDGRVTVTANALTQEELQVCPSVTPFRGHFTVCLSVLKTPLVNEEGREQDQWRWPSRLVSTKLCYTGSTPPSVQLGKWISLWKERKATADISPLFIQTYWSHLIKNRLSALCISLINKVRRKAALWMNFNCNHSVINN